MNLDDEIKLYKITLSIKAGVAVNLPGHKLTGEEAKTLAINSVKKLFKDCDIIGVEELDAKK